MENKTTNFLIDNNVKIKLKELVKNLEKDFPEEIKNQSQPYKFLKKHDYDVNEAEISFRKKMKWLKENKYDNVKEEDLKDIISKGASFIFGEDKNKRPVLVIKSSRRTKNDVNFIIITKV